MLVVVFWKGIWKERDIGINFKNFLLILICPQFICGCSFDFFWVMASQKSITNSMI